MADTLSPNETEAILRPHPDVPQELGNHLHQFKYVILQLLLLCLPLSIEDNAATSFSSFNSVVCFSLGRSLSQFHLPQMFFSWSFSTTAN